MGCAHFRTPWSGGVSSGGGQINAIVDAFPVALAEQLFNQGGVGNDLSATLNLRVQALGTTNVGTEMQSDPFDFPLEVCVGCLVANVQACPFASAPTNPGNACNPAQDAPSTAARRTARSSVPDGGVEVSTGRVLLALALLGPLGLLDQTEQQAAISSRPVAAGAAGPAAPRRTERSR